MEAELVDDGERRGGMELRQCDLIPGIEKRIRDYWGGSLLTERDP